MFSNQFRAGYWGSFFNFERLFLNPLMPKGCIVPLFVFGNVFQVADTDFLTN